MTRGVGVTQEKTRLTPRRGRPREDVKQVKIPETAYKMLYAFAEAHNLTFGDAAAYLIAKGMERVGKVRKDDARGAPVFTGTRRQVKISKGAHSLLWVFAEERSMTLGDAAALLIGLELMRLYNVDEDESTRQKRLQREKRRQLINLWERWEQNNGASQPKNETKP